ncbi:MAG TPA: hypothetical protein VIC06_00335 [Solirubrobacteraceae bacterium]|jgi:hypothetical protein
MNAGLPLGSCESKTGKVIRVKTLFTLAALGALTLTLSACESTESESARLGREGAKLIAGAGTVGLGGSNRAVHVGQVALVQGTGRTAAVVQLTNTAAGAQSDVPVLIDVRSPAGASLYRNDIQGLEPSLQQMPLLPAHASAWWVDDQVLAAGKPAAVKVRIGDPKGSPPRGNTAGSSGSPGSPGVQVSATSLGSDVAGPYLAGEVVNRSGVAQHNMPIFAVALRGGRIVAAGRALVPNLPASGGKPTGFRIYLIGSPAGAHIELTPAPAMGA